MSSKWWRASGEPADKAKGVGNPADLSSGAKRESRRIFGGGLSGHEKLLISELGRRRPLRHKGQVEVADDPVHYGIVGDEGDDPHPAAALRTDQRIHLVDLADHLGPALGRDRPELLLNNPERKRPKACLLDLPSMGIGVQPILC